MKHLLEMNHFLPTLKTGNAKKSNVQLDIPNKSELIKEFLRINKKTSLGAYIRGSKTVEEVHNALNAIACTIGMLSLEYPELDFAGKFKKETEYRGGIHSFCYTCNNDLEIHFTKSCDADGMCSASYFRVRLYYDAVDIYAGNQNKISFSMRNFEPEEFEIAKMQLYDEIKKMLKL